MNLRKSILALSVVAGIVAAPMTVFAAHTHSWGSPQYYGYEDEMPGMYHYRQVYNQKIESIENISKFLESTLSAFFDNMKGEINAKKTTFCISTNYFMLFIRM